MTTSELISYYVDLLIMQYNNKKKAKDTISLLADLAVMDNLPIDVKNGFDTNTAYGAQLDIIGKYAGVSRIGKTFTEVIELSDDEFRSLIKIAIVKNYSQSSLYDIQLLLNNFFPGTIIVFDFKNMAMGYLFDSSIGSENLAEMFVVNELLPKPMGVQLGSLIYSNNIKSFFGYRTYQLPGVNNTGFNSYTDYSTVSPWLSYDYAIIV